MRRSWPQMPIRKYMGISITSQNKKKRNRSSETKTPMTPVSSTSSEMKKPFTRWSIDFQDARIEIDGLSVFLLLLTTLLTPISILASWKSIDQRVKGFFISLLVLETGVIGVFVSLDLFLFFLFWEVMLIPMYFLIGIWGHERRIYAALKFVLYTMFGSILMLVAIVWLYRITAAAGYPTFDIAQIQMMLSNGTLTMSIRTA